MAEGRREPGVLTTARYGKDKVRVFRVVRDPQSKVHDVVEYSVTILVEGAIETRYVPTPDARSHLLGCRRIGVLIFRGGGAVTHKRTIVWLSRRTQVGRPPIYSYQTS
jgi:Uricase